MGVRLGWAGCSGVQLTAGARELERRTRSVTRDVRWGERRRLRENNVAPARRNTRGPDAWRSVAQCATGWSPIARRSIARRRPARRLAHSPRDQPSSVTPTIDIQVSVDGHRVVDHVFPFRYGHTKLTVEIPLDPGHRLVSIIGNRGAVRLDTSFDAKGHQWAWAQYWYEPPEEPGRPDLEPRRFTFDVSNEPSYLR